MNEKQESTADRVRLLRGYLRLSQEALGQRVGVAKSTISGIERGAQGISGIAGDLARALGTMIFPPPIWSGYLPTHAAAGAASDKRVSPVAARLPGQRACSHTPL